MASQSQGRGRSSQKTRQLSETVSEPEIEEEDIEQLDQSDTDEPIRTNGDYTGSTDILQQGSSKHCKHHCNALEESSDESAAYTPPRKKDIYISIIYI
jgi:hypothetical protein